MTLINYTESITSETTICDALILCNKQVAHFARLIKTSEFKKLNLDVKRQFVSSYESVIALRSSYIDRKYSILSGISNN